MSFSFSLNDYNLKSFMVLVELTRLVSSCVVIIFYKYFLCFRFFLMYLINKDETEHTGQVNYYFSSHSLLFFHPD